MILDGNTDWNPDDPGEAIDPGATVGIGPLPQRSPAGHAGPADDPENGAAHLGPMLDPALPVGQVGGDRPPMVTETGPVEEASDPAPRGWIATGPLPAGGADVGPLPTGPIPVTAPPASPASGSGPAARVILQAAVVLLAAGLVGLVVFGVLRSAADDAGGSDRAGGDGTDDLAIAPGPGVSGGGEDVLGSKRGTAGVGQRSTSDDDQIDADRGQDGAGGVGTATDDDTDPGSPATGPPISNGTGQGSGPVGQGDGPAGPATAVDRPGAPTSLGQRPVTSTTGSFGGSTSAVTSDPPDRPTTTGRNTTTRPATSTSGRPPTTRPITTRPATTRPTTTAPSTTARPSTTAPTTTIALPASLIAAPSNGSDVNWNLWLNLRANEVPGADTYCWTLIGSGGELTQCSDGPDLRFPGRRTAPGPGPVTIRAEARTQAGAVLLGQEISIDLLARRFVRTPWAGRNVDLDDGLRLQARRTPSADRYCWTLSQGSTRSGPLCTADRRLDLSADSPSLDGFGPGPVTVRASAQRGGVVIGLQTVAFEFTAP